MKIINFIKEVIFIELLLIFLDYFLIKLINNKARWFQLHVVGNTVVTFLILKDNYLLFFDPINNYQYLENNLISSIIFTMHLHHVLCYKLARIDYFHHIIFILFGVIPTIIYIKTNQIYFGYIACSGIPGIIEYSSLTLYKNNIISYKQQKKINIIVYNFIRFPLCIYGVTCNILFRHLNFILNNDDLFFSLYINFLLYLNGSFFNLLTVISYYKNSINS